MHTRFLPAILLMLVLGSCADSRIKEHQNWGRYFKEHGIDSAAFMLRDQTHETVHYYNKEGCTKRYTPASTFKIMNALVALETGVAPNENMVIRWDSVQRPVHAWNQDLNMREAFRLSSVPYFQELARRIGKNSMQHYLDTVQYGNKQIGGAVDSFWLNNTLQVTADEQVGLIRRLYFGELPFSDLNQRLVRSMMLQEDSAGHRLYYKTGWGRADGKNVMWVVGFAERIVHIQEAEGSMNKADFRTYPYFFALNFTVPETDTSKDWAALRISILKELLYDYGALK